MKFGFRTPSLRKRISARTSLKRIARQSMGLKVPSGYGVFTNPKKAIYNRVYRKTTTGCASIILLLIIILAIILNFFFKKL